jgi:hypothetical protein
MDWHAQHTLHLTRAFGAPLYRAFFASVGGLVQNSGSANPARAGELRRSGRPLRARPEWRGGLRPPVRPGSLRSRRPNLRVQLTLRLVHCVPRLAQLTRRAIGPPIWQGVEDGPMEVL